MKLKISLLLPMLFALLVGVSILQGVMAVQSIDQVNGQMSRLNALSGRSLSVADVDSKLSEVRRLYLMILNASNANDKKALVESLQVSITALDTASAAYGAGIQDPQARERFDAYSAVMRDYSALGEQFVAQAMASKLYQAKDTIAKMVPLGGEAGKILKDMIADNVALSSAEREASAAASDVARYSTLAAVVFAALLALAAALVSISRVTRPIGEITASMKKLAEGDTAAVIPHEGRHDEIGEMAAAVSVFRENALERERLELQAEADRSLSETERLAREEQKAREAAEVQFAVEQLASGLQRLSDGDLTVKIDQGFAAQLDALRLNFNQSVTRLHDVMRDVVENARAIDAGANEMLAASGDLSKRTEQQASSVEQTAAALDEVTTAVKDSAQRAEQAGALVGRTKQGAEHSGDVVRRAVDAMQKIENSSSQISNIIGVIDDIAFQTNLLALNAGVEAARAGDAGKGFAVVAQEVRELAQRSANAAKEIKVLITASGDQVRSGVALVGETGRALEAIVTQVQEINRNVAAIVTSAREQSTGLQEISAAVNHMDQGTQKNAAMVEQSTASSHGLAQQANALRELTAQFRLAGQSERGYPAHVAPSSRPVPSPARGMAGKVARAFQGNAAVAKDWSEF
ncbi:methyl-accepting chemotaxis protein [Rhizobium sp. AAP43]|uniref:methyl-accepting chemotaxis protein n=1 Tax=Rhizobium sp. AAP43 TaxID=1523420 RepID=UPI0006B8FAF4|nr:HAMP domain-containing methyl-accepting chemotaxis protein [Rhizobium sp. AAP43]KPF45600.1 chemotaxis protein [Rhizobium sp. AAP43]